MLRRLFGIGKRKKADDGDDEIKEETKKPKVEDEAKRVELGVEGLYHLMNQINFMSWLDEDDNSKMVKTDKLSRSMLKLDKPMHFFL